MPEPDLPGQQIESGSALPDALLRTKLYRPRVSGEILHRERLHQLLGRTLTVPLTVVSGPASPSSAASWLTEQSILSYFLPLVLMPCPILALLAYPL